MGQQAAELGLGRLPVAPGSAVAFGHTPHHREFAYFIKRFM
jgi:hypothetical protein